MQTRRQPWKSPPCKTLDCHGLELEQNETTRLIFHSINLLLVAFRDVSWDVVFHCQISKGCHSLWPKIPDDEGECGFLQSRRDWSESTRDNVLKCRNPSNYHRPFCNFCGDCNHLPMYMFRFDVKLYQILVDQNTIEWVDTNTLLPLSISSMPGKPTIEHPFRSESSETPTRASKRVKEYLSSPTPTLQSTCSKSSSCR